ncbi:MAG: putative metal-binding motif-containing protein [Phycisphaerales bacterium]|nr:putative metal-binding motif-containing protein [Phycisphaerales bacterium]
MNCARLTKTWVLFVSVTLMLPGPLAQAASHLWRVNEVFSNADGTVQFIELKESLGEMTENGVGGKTVTSNTKTFTIPSNVAGSTANKHLLLATSAFAALPGVPTPDHIIVSNFFAVNGDTIKYAPAFNYDTFTFGAGALPTDGVNSIRITNYTTHTFTTGPKTPTNYAGQTICIDNDSDGYGSPGNVTCPNGSALDCNDNNVNINPGATENTAPGCTDALDNDCDTFIDCADSGCAGVVSEVCDDAIDNDCNGLTDCADPACAAVVPCIPTLSGTGLAVAAVLLVVAGQVVIVRRRRLARP